MTAAPTKRAFSEITTDEVKLYDRQIRLWGLEAQSRMRNSRILVIGVNALSNEVLKNIVLAGVGHVTLMDSTPVTPKDLGSQFLLRKENVGENKAECAVSKLTLLNPRVELHADKCEIERMDVDFVKTFDLVVQTSGTPSQLLSTSEMCRKHSVKYWASQNYGMHSFIFADLEGHEYVTEVKQSGQDGEKSMTTSRKDKYTPLKEVMGRKFGFESKTAARKWKRKAHPLFFAISVVWEFFKVHKRWPDVERDSKALSQLHKTHLYNLEVDESFVPLDLTQQIAKCHSVEFSPSCAIVGGFLGQEVLKVLARKEVPFNNIFLHDAWEATGFRMQIS